MTLRVAIWLPLAAMLVIQATVLWSSAAAAPVPKRQDRLVSSSLAFTNPKLKAALDALRPEARRNAQAALEANFFTVGDSVTVSEDGILQIVDNFVFNFTAAEAAEDLSRQRRELVSDMQPAAYTAAGQLFLRQKKKKPD